MTKHLVRFTEAYSFKDVYIVVENITSIKAHEVHTDRWTVIISGSDKNTVIGSLNTIFDAIDEATSQMEVVR